MVDLLVTAGIAVCTAILAFRAGYIAGAEEANRRCHSIHVRRGSLLPLEGVSRETGS